MNKRTAQTILEEMRLTGYQDLILMHATYNDGAKGYEVITTDPQTQKPLRINSRPHWEKIRKTTTEV